MKIQYSEQNKKKRNYITYVIQIHCVYCLCRDVASTDNLVQCGYEVRFTNVKAYVLMETTACTATINCS